MPTSITSLLTAVASPASLALLGTTALKATLILAIASAVVLLLRRSTAASRHLVWATALAGALLLPVLNVVLPEWYVSLPGGDALRALGGRIASPTTEQRLSFKVSTSPAAPSATAESEHRTRTAATEPTLGASTGNARASDGPSDGTGAVDATIHDVKLTDTAPPASTASILLGIWIAGVIAALLPLVVGAWQLSRLGRGARDVESDALDDFAARLARSLGVRRLVRLVEGGANATPMTWGTLHPVVLVPAGFDAWSDDQKREVLLHELAHVARYDCLSQNIARVACAFYWFNPLAWVAARQLRIERERSCDDHVLLAGARASSYADHLLTIARTLRAPGATSVAALAMARPSHLEGRLLALLDARRARGVVTSRTAGLMAAAAIVIAASIATLQPWGARIAAADEPEQSIDLPASNYERAAADTDSVHHARSDSVRTNTGKAGVGSAGSGVASSAGTGTGTGTGIGNGVGDGLGRGVGGGTGATRETWATPNGELVLDPGSTLTANVGANAESPKKFSLPGCEIPRNSSSSAQVWEDDDQHLRVRVKRGSCQILLEALGKVTYNDQFTDIATIANGGWLELSDKGGQVEHKLRIVANDNGVLARSWTVDGQSRTYDDGAKTWLATTLEELDRYTQFSNGARLTAVYKKSGVKGVLDETASTSGDYAKRQNLARLFKIAKLDEAQLGRVLDMVKTDVKSDYERSEILRSLVKEGVITPALQVKYVAAAADISSGYERGRALEALTNAGNLTTQSQIAIYRAAANTSSDYDRSQLMKSVMKKYGLSLETAPAFLQTAKSIGSDYDLRVLLVDAIKQLPDNAPGSMIESMLTTAKTNINSDYDLAEFLITVANTRPLDEAQRARIVDAAESVKSEHDYGRVMSALRKRKTTNSL